MQALRASRHASQRTPLPRTMPRRAHAAARQSGVGLIEVLISILIFSFGVLGLVGLQTRATLFSVSAEDTNRAALLANEVSAAMWNNNSVSLPAATITAWQDRVASAAVAGLGPSASGVVSVSGNVAEIRITWRPPQAASSAAANRYVTQVVVR